MATAEPVGLAARCARLREAVSARCPVDIGRRYVGVPDSRSNQPSPPPLDAGSPLAERGDRSPAEPASKVPRPVSKWSPFVRGELLGDRAVDDAAAAAFGVQHGGRAATLPSVAIVIAAYNEEGVVGSVVDALPNTLCGLGTMAIVVSDGSKDGTVEEAGAHGALVCDVPVNRGQGAALRLGYRATHDLKSGIATVWPEFAPAGGAPAPGTGAHAPDGKAAP